MDTPTSASVAANLQQVHGAIDQACCACARASGEVRLLCVSKTKGEDLIKAAYEQGERHFGESYVSEAVGKIESLRAQGFNDIVWHFIGPIQSNKTKHIAAHFDVVESVERRKILERLSAQRPDDLPPLKVMLQVNISQEEQKQGCEVEDLPELLEAASSLPKLELIGLMGVARIDASEAELNAQFGQLKALQERFVAQYPGLRELSMGMTHDLGPAIAQGSTEVRIGTAIFGERDYSKMHKGAVTN